MTRALLSEKLGWILLGKKLKNLDFSGTTNHDETEKVKLKFKYVKEGKCTLIIYFSQFRLFISFRSQHSN